METQRNHLRGRFQMSSNQQDSLPGWARLLLGAIMLWCAAQAAYLIVAFSAGPPSPTPVLLFVIHRLPQKRGFGALVS